MLIVDGHNVAFADDEARRLLVRGKPDAARARVLEIVEVYARATKQPAVVVFDGTGGRYRASKRGRGVRCRFSGAGRPADAEIVRLVGARTGRREICVATSDRSLGAAVRSLHARTMGAKEFLREAARLRRKRPDRFPEPAGKRTGAPPSEVEHWLKVFGDADAAADANVRQERKPRTGRPPLPHARR